MLFEAEVKISLYILGISLFYAGFLGFLFFGIDRKLVARMQGRVGPPIRQPFLDFMKLCGKEDIIPHNATAWLFKSAPILALASVMTVMLYIPVGFTPIFAYFGDLIFILYLLTLASLAIVIGASSSSSLFAALGAQRELVMLISCKVPLAILIFGLAWRINPLVDVPFSLLSFSQVNLWSMADAGFLTFIGVAMLFFTFLCCIPGELGAGPFDIGKAKTEIAGGPLVEYSGRSLATFKLAEAIKLIAISSLAVALFFPIQLSNILGIAGLLGIILDSLFHLLKIFLIIFVSLSVVKTVMARLKITQAVRFYWFVLTPFALTGLIFIMIEYYYLYLI